MTGLKEWARELVSIVVVGGLLEMAIPAGSLRRYARFATGLLILVTVLHPALDLLRTGQVLVQAAAARPLGISDGAGAAVDERVRAVRTQIARHATELFRSRLEAAAAEAARQVPGVRTARVEVEPQPARDGMVRMRVRLGAAARDDGRLAAEVRRRLAQRFELAPERIDVQVGG